MKRKINLRLIEIALLAVCLITIGMTVVYYEIYKGQVEKDLQMTGRVLSETGMFTESHNAAPSLHIDNLRVTWIDTDGTVIYDNDMNIGELSNHSDRPEVIEAFQHGEGTIIRDSETMNHKNFYYAIQQSNGTVLRVAIGARSIWNVFFRSFPIIFIVLLIVVSVCVLFAHYLTKQLLLPLQHVAENLDDSTLQPEYKELIPFIETIRSQHENILMAARVRQDFTANVSHELKTPLTAILGYSELIENGMTDKQSILHFSSEIHRNASRLLSLIDDIIRLSELDQSKSQTGFEELDLKDIVDACVENIRISAAQKDIVFSCQCESCKLTGNRHMIQELIENLCSNAIRYNSPGGYVILSVHNENSHPVIAVTDNGIGIPLEQQDRIFERFYRVDKSRSRNTGGTGLGLAIVKHIVELHHAALTLESTPGKGTSIAVKF